MRKEKLDKAMFREPYYIFYLMGHSSEQGTL